MRHDHLQEPWRKRSLDGATALFQKHGFRGRLWYVD